MVICINEIASRILTQSYLAKNAEGETIETIDDMFRRVAKTVAEADKHYEENEEETENEFYRIMSTLLFLPNSPTLMNAGLRSGQLSACFVLPVEDSLTDIFDAIKKAALIHKSGGGTGFSFSKLRGKNELIKTTGGKASGPVSFMRVFNAATETVCQGGVRRGANIGILNVEHPNIEEFIDCKINNNNLTNFNISVAVSDAFMQAVEKDINYELIDPCSKKCVGKKSARHIFKKIVDSAWNNGEPGLLFIDQINRCNVLKDTEMIEATNPCGEQPLLPYESCNLGSINLTKCLVNDDKVYKFDTNLIKETVCIAVHFLDNVIDVNKYPLDEIKEKTLGSRKIGLGVMGFADALLHLNIPYNSDEALTIAGDLMKFINECAQNASIELARKRGSYPKYLPEHGPQKRNATVTTIAPTGTLSLIAGCSSGIEPIFAYVYSRKIMDEDKIIINPVLEKKLKELELFKKDLIDKIQKDGTLSRLTELPDILKKSLSVHMK